MSEADIYNKNDPSNDTGTWFKLKDGEEAKIRIFSPASQAVRFESLYKPTNTQSLRFAWVIYNHTVKKAQIFVASATVYSMIKNLITSDEYGDVTNYDISIRREGEGTDTRYHLTPGRLNYELKPDPIFQCKAIDLKAIIMKSENNSQVMTLKEFNDMVDVDQTPRNGDSGEAEEETY